MRGWCGKFGVVGAILDLRALWFLRPTKAVPFILGVCVKDGDLQDLLTTGVNIQELSILLQLIRYCQSPSQRH